MNVAGLVPSFLLRNRSWEQFAILLARVALGLFSAISGGKKLFVASRTRQMYENAGRCQDSVSALYDVFRFLG